MDYSQDLSKLDHPVVLFVRGLPGSGKSYLTDELAKQFDPSHLVVLDPDATDYNSPAYAKHVKLQSAEGVDPKLHAYRYLRAQAYAGIADHKIVLWNQPFTNLEIFNKMVANLRIQAEENHTALPILVVEVEVDPTTAQARIAERKQAGGHGPSANTFAQRQTDYFSFADHGYTTVTVHGKDDVQKSIAIVMQALRSLVRK
jgi:thymidylate kinase